MNRDESVTDGFKGTVTTERRAIRTADFKIVRTAADLVRAPGTTIGTRAIMDLLSVLRLFGTVTVLTRILVMERITSQHL